MAEERQKIEKKGKKQVKKEEKIKFGGRHPVTRKKLDWGCMYKSVPAVRTFIRNSSQKRNKE